MLSVPPRFRRTFDANYTLGEPRVKVTRPVSNDIAADFHKWNTATLAAPLRQGLDIRPVISATSSAVSSRDQDDGFHIRLALPCSNLERLHYSRSLRHSLSES